MANTEIERLRSDIQNDRRHSRGPFSDSLRERLIEFVLRGKEHGHSAQALSDELGISSKTVSLWLKQSKQKLRKVRVVRETPAAAARSFNLHGPAGTVLEGLSVEEVVLLWKKLGC